MFTLRDLQGSSRLWAVCVLPSGSHFVSFPNTAQRSNFFSKAVNGKEKLRLWMRPSSADSEIPPKVHPPAQLETCLAFRSQSACWWKIPVPGPNYRLME